jgi:hypothetical protein
MWLLCFVGKQESKEPLGGPNQKWGNKIKMDLQEERWIGGWAERKLNLSGSGSRQGMGFVTP